jgi:type IV secretory pathway TraG/TraD family ATPase VirD4
MSNQKTEQSIITQLIEQGELNQILASPLGLVTLISFILLACLYINKGFSRRKKLARARWAGDREIKAARKQACKQLEQGKYNKVALYISRTATDLPIRVKGKYLLRIPASKERLYFPDANRGIFVSGVNGSGKSYSCIDRLLWSAFDQGLPVLHFDHKYNQGDESQTARIAGYALERGYKVSIFAPGYPESGIINPLDFLEDEFDDAIARELALTINANSRLADKTKGDPFFTAAANLLTQGIFQVAKKSKYPDILMGLELLRLAKLPERIDGADMSEWIKKSFSQLEGTKESEKTVASIIGTTLELFNRFSVRQLLPAFCGKTNIDLDLTGRKLLIFGASERTRKITSPLLAAIIQMVITQNMATKRNHALVCCLDEFATIYLPYLANWLNEKREQGFVGILGLQSYTQLEQYYGREGANIIFTGCVTKLLFNPGSEITAEKYVRYLGEEEVMNTSSKTNRNKSGTNTDISKDYGRRPLFELSQFNTLPKGRAVIINPGFANYNQANLPLLHQIRLSEDIPLLQKRSVEKWNEYKQVLISKNDKEHLDEDALKKRKAEAEWLLPLPKNEDNKQSQVEDDRQFMNNKPHLKRTTNEGEDEWLNQNPCPEGTLRVRKTMQ